jgi:limonene-1,2-epoxide hydrolase
VRQFFNVATRLGQAFGVRIVRSVQHSIFAENGSTVLTERVDEVTANGIMAPVPVMGTFEVKDGRIVEWRDYFDMGLVGKLLSGENVGSLLPR